MCLLFIGIPLSLDVIVVFILCPTRVHRRLRSNDAEYVSVFMVGEARLCEFCFDVYPINIVRYSMFMDILGHVVTFVCDLVIMMCSN